MVWFCDTLGTGEHIETCAECGKEFAITDWYIRMDGKVVRCPHCGAENNILCSLCMEWVWDVHGGIMDEDWCVDNGEGCFYERVVVKGKD